MLTLGLTPGPTHPSLDRQHSTSARSRRCQQSKTEGEGKHLPEKEGFKVLARKNVKRNEKFHPVGTVPMVISRAGSFRATPDQES
ncbi:hypothetical protein Y1Q_0023517 [Alligator mississippiensis]|uniref:Uncharacterized protein n=1 Tax=Alligator mississippiensis TaxID=8496 RepID=A0A151NQ71_ALLMI|nr:hypothetical protein Y1Q_0023517 [Alligator mississippiensis]